MKKREYVDMTDAKGKRLYVGCKVDLPYFFSETNDVMELKRDANGVLYFLSLVDNHICATNAYGLDKIVLIEESQKECSCFPVPVGKIVKYLIKSKELVNELIQQGQIVVSTHNMERIDRKTYYLVFEYIKSDMNEDFVKLTKEKIKEWAGGLLKSSPITGKCKIFDSFYSFKIIDKNGKKMILGNSQDSSICILCDMNGENCVVRNGNFYLDVARMKDELKSAINSFLDKNDLPLIKSVIPEPID